MRILFSLLVTGVVLATLTGCSPPEAEFAWSEDTQNLLPEARKTVQTYVKDRFGTPAEMVAWQRLPVNFGGIPGRVKEVYRETFDDEKLVTGFKIDFVTQAMIANYDVNLDGQLSQAELPMALQEELSDSAFSKADQDQDGFLSGSEVVRLRTRSELLEKDDLDQVTPDNAEELVGKELLFVNGTFSGVDERTKITKINAEEGIVSIWPPISEIPKGEDKAVELVFDRVIVDFGKTMRSGRHLYMRHCMHCHGVTGDGNGPTAEYLNPLPRDYRKGLFKFISTRTDTVRHPARHDIKRILQNGIPGTYMPSFAMLKDEEIADITEYVRWLAMRGEYEGKMNVYLAGEGYSKEALERKIRNELAGYEAKLKAYEENGAGKRPEPVSRDAIRQEVQTDLDEYLKEDFPEEIDNEATRLADVWRSAEIHANIIYPQLAKPESTPESIARGRTFYLKECAVCHGVLGEGNGENTRGYQKDPEGNEYPEPGFFDAWGQPIQPRNLTRGIYRGGRRPLDIYRRIHQGIPGTPMVGFASKFKDEQIWDLVDYVMSIPIDGPIPVSSPVADSSEAKKNADEPTESSGE